MAPVGTAGAGLVDRRTRRRRRRLPDHEPGLMRASVRTLTTGDALARPETGAAPRARVRRGKAMTAATSTHAEYGAEPWRAREVIQFAALTVVGLVLLGAGWFGAGGEA